MGGQFLHRNRAEPFTVIGAAASSTAVASRVKEIIYHITDTTQFSSQRTTPRGRPDSSPRSHDNECIQF
jgi:hypothetical protein